MTVPVFEEYEPAGDCVCPGCARQRRERARALPVRAGGHPAAHGARRALVLVTAVGAVLGGGGSEAFAAAAARPSPPPGPEAAAPRAAPSAPRPGGADVRAGHGRPQPARASAGARPRADPAGADRVRGGPARADRTAADRLRAGDQAVAGRGPGPDPDTPQGGQEPLHGGPAAGPAGTAGLRTMARADIVSRAKRWVNAKVPYSMSRYWADGYRQDCSGYVSMAWHLPGNEWTGSLAEFGTRIERKDLQPGDILLFHNAGDPSQGSHVTIFGGWADGAHTKYVAYEQAKPHTRRQITPMAYWSNSGQYEAYRYKALKGVAPADGQLAGGEGTVFPGAGLFGPGEDNAYVALLGRLLAGYGFDVDGTAGPGSRWGEEHRQATRAFQRAQGWTGAEADGAPGPDTWSLLVNGTGRKAAPTPAAGTAPSGHTAALPAGTGPAAGSAPAGPRAAASAAGAPARSGTAPAAAAAPRKAVPPAVSPAAPPIGAAVTAPPAFPGHRHFRPGSSSGHVDTLRGQLVKRGFGRHYSPRPGPRWGDADRRSVEAFQRTQGWRGAAADGYPGPETWRRLFS
ncbi:peptidoglycan-binding protein [Streptomyces sp. NPDC049910]|uniref:peptidoglycan-binding protein n=1 Tax=Streptomyces sp. NPDC049910 TaxID=3155278 RepID=UPI00341490E5